jgi:hypothetical protein
MSKNLVMGMSCGYDLEKIKPFILSLRQYYNDDIVVLIDRVTADHDKFFEDNRVYSYIPDDPLVRNTCQLTRYEHYLNCINDHFQDVDNILIADIRDVVFQSDPFAEYPKHSLEFFAESVLFKNCVHNTPWVAANYGQQRVSQIGEKNVICSGTTMGTRKGIIEYCQAMSNEIKRFALAGRPIVGWDQPLHNHLIYSNIFNDYSINYNGIGPVSTMHYFTQLTFNRKGLLLNDDGKVTPIVHQYDRCGPMGTVFVKNALNGKGRAGMKAAADYAIANFFEHDLD